MNELDIFSAALERQSLEERGRYLDEACGADRDLRRRIEELLRAYAQAGSFRGVAAAERAGQTTMVVPHNAQPGTVIGPYKLIEQIGEGGMGTVWMAQQMEPVKRAVALKLIKAGMDSRQVIARFGAERQALALMDHANIAKILDAGTTQGEAHGWQSVGLGRPYFVMELVRGVPITQYCDEHRLTPRQRLELFIPVCQAVQHAHQKGIIHRDLKPSNVLVALYDGKPVPKVIDFGVAKAAGQALTDKTLVTGFGNIVGTLEYMSPEQAEVNQLDIDTRSDIYSLGVLLYELLAGSPPFSRKELEKAGMLEMLRVIREQEPSKPSTKLSSSDALPTLSANRGTEPAKLTKLVRGELDWIVMKALEKDRNRRYETANGFAMDVQRYLADEAVQACPPSVGYRLRKFVWRNKGPVIAVSVVVLSLVGGIVGTSLGLAWALSERDAKARALIAETKAKQAEIKQRENKEQALAAETMARESEKQARLQAMAALRAMTDDVVENQMARAAILTEENKEFLRKIVKHFEGFAAIAADDVESRGIRAEGNLRVGLMRYNLGELSEAEAAYCEALSLLKQLAAEFPARAEFRSTLASTHMLLGNLLRTTGRMTDAEAAYGDALALLARLTAEFPNRPEYRSDLAGNHNSLGLVLSKLGRLKQAETAYSDAVVIERRLVADFPTRPEFRNGLASSHNNAGLVLRAMGRLKEAEAAHDEALALQKQLAADFPTRFDFRQTLAGSHINLGRLYHATGRLKEAEGAFRDALSIQKELAADFPTRPDSRQDLANCYNNLGNLLRDTGRPREAEAAYADALVIQKQLAADFTTRPEYRQALAGLHFNLSLLLRPAGRLKEAEEAVVEALALQKQLVADFPTRPEFRNDLAASNHHLGLLLRTTGRLKEAESAYADALAVRKQLAADFPTRPEFRQALAKSHDNLGNLFRETGRPKEADAAYAESLALRRQLAADSPDQPDLRHEVATTCVNLAALRWDESDLRLAKSYLVEAGPHHVAALMANPGHPDYRAVYRHGLTMLIQINAGLGDLPGAKQAAEQLRNLGWNAMDNAYRAACCLSLCIPIVQKLDHMPKADRDLQVQAYGDEALTMLSDAIAKGFRSAAQLKNDKNLDALRDRADFRKLLVELEAPAKPAKRKDLPSK